MTPEQKKHYWAIAQANDDTHLMKMVILETEPDSIEMYLRAQKLLDELYIDRA